MDWSRTHKKQVPYYLKKLSWAERNYKLFIIGGSTIAVLCMCSAPIYYLFIAKPEDYPEAADPNYLFWASEKKTGKTLKQQWIEANEKRMAKYQEFAAIKDEERRIAQEKKLAEGKTSWWNKFF